MTTKERTSITMTTTRTNYVSSETGGRKKKMVSSSTEKEFIPMKWVQFFLDGEPVTEKIKVPVDEEYYEEQFDILAEKFKYRLFPEELKFEIKETLVLHPQLRDKYLTVRL